MTEETASRFNGAAQQRIEPHRNDPRQLETFLQGLKGVLAARVEKSDDGAAKTRIHLVVRADRSIGQAVQDARSAVLARYGIPFEAETFWVSQVQNSEMWTTQSDGLRLVGLQAGIREGRIEAQVEINWQGKSFRGEANLQGTPERMTQAMARATANAIAQILDGRAQLSVEDLQEIQMAGRTGVVSALATLQAGKEYLHLGCAWSDGDARFAAAQAILDAARKLPLTTMLSG